MQNGEFIKDRWIVGMVKGACAEIGAEVHSFSDDWVLELQKGELRGRIFGYKFGLNNAVAASIAQDKVAAFQVMTAHGINAVEHYLVRPSDDSTWSRMPLKTDVIAKPLTGTGGRGVERYANRDLARQKINESNIDAWAVSPFYDIGREIRLVILDDDILLSYEKHPVLENGLKFFNLGKGATPMQYKPSASTQRLAREAMQALGLRVGAVDVIVCEDGEVKVLEVNDGIMMENFARYSGSNKASAQDVYNAIIAKMF